MNIIAKLLHRLRALFRKEELDQELSDEMAFHLEKQIEQNIAAGMRAEEARYAALRSFGGVEQVKEECRDTWGVRFIDALVRDIRFGLRQLRRNPGFTAVAVLTLALGIGANTAIFSVVYAVLLRPLPFHDPSRLVQLWETEAAPGDYPLAGPDYLDWQAQTQTLEGTSLFDWGKGFNASGAGEPEQAYVVQTQANFFSLLGVEPLVGRTFLAGEDQAGRNFVAILSHGFWQRHFGGGKDAVGKNLDLNGEKYAVVGVMPAWFGVLGGADIWIPMDMSLNNLGPRSRHQYRVIGRLKRGVPAAKAQAELKTIAQRLERQYPDLNSKVGATVVPLKEQLVGYSQTELLILLGAVGLVLLIACANVANLSLVRATGRHREIAVRRAVGATRGRVVRQLLTESVLLSLLGAACGLLLGWGCLRLLASAEIMPVPRPNPITLNGTVLAFTFGVGLLVGVLVGLAPVLQVSQLQLSEELRTAVQAVLGPSGRRRILRDALVVCEIAISLALLIGAGLLLRSFAKLREVEVGIHPQGVLTAQIVLPPKRYATPEQAKAFFDQLLDGLKGAPGVETAAVGTELPLNGGNNGYVTIEGRESSAFENILVGTNHVTPEYFRAFGIPFLKGRNFTQQDSQNAAEIVRQVVAMMQSGKMQAPPGGPLVAVINHTMGRQFWPNQDPLGKVFKLGGKFPVMVVGIVGDVKEGDIRSPVIPQAYYPLSLALTPPVSTMSIVVKGAAGTKALPATVRSQVHSLDSSLALFNVRTMQEVISQSMTDTSYQSLLLSSFALLALLLTAVGIYGVMAYTVTQRTHEIGIRLALGAHPREILRLILRQGVQLTLAGVALGAASALVLTRFLASLLFGIQPGDPYTFIVVATGLAVVALLACYIPARRAAKVDPMVALRYE
jgi:putative ABC transport system permease protein